MQAFLLAAVAVTALDGQVLDARSGSPVPGALIQQVDGAATAIAGPDGRFRILLEATGAKAIAVSDPGHEREVLPVLAKGTVRVLLAPLAGFAPRREVEAVAPLGQIFPPLRPGLEIDYRLRRTNVTAGASQLNGLANNDVRLGYRWRDGPWLVEGEGAHWQTPVNVPMIARAANPAFSPSSWQAGLMAGRSWALAPDLEVAAAGTYRFQVTTPNNGDVPYTGGPLDFEQTRHAVGPTIMAAWQRGPLRLEGRAGWLPLAWAAADAPGQPFGGEGTVDARLAAYWRLMPGLSLGLGYGWETWRGNGSEDAHILGLKLQYVPESPERTP